MTNHLLQEIVCCIGQPVAGNPAQFIMEKAFARAGLDWRFLTLEVPAESFGDAMRGIRAMGLRGVYVANPHRGAVLEHLDEQSDVVRLVGTANCVTRRGGQLVGENTDGKGLLAALGGAGEVRGAHVAVMGAGQVARAVAIELALAGAGPITVVARNPEQGQSLVELLVSKTGVPAEFRQLDGQYEVPETASVFINATSIGFSNPAARVPVVPDSLRPELIVADMVFNPPTTALLREASERGCRTVDGLGTLVNQAAIAFRLWTGVEPDGTTMREAIEEFFGL